MHKISVHKDYAIQFYCAKDKQKKTLDLFSFTLNLQFLLPDRKKTIKCNRRNNEHEFDFRRLEFPVSFEISLDQVSNCHKCQVAWVQSN